MLPSVCSAPVSMITCTGTLPTLPFTSSRPPLRRRAGTTRTPCCARRPVDGMITTRSCSKSTSMRVACSPLMPRMPSAPPSTGPGSTGRFIGGSCTLPALRLSTRTAWSTRRSRDAVDLDLRVAGALQPELFSHARRQRGRVRPGVEYEAVRPGTVDGHRRMNPPGAVRARRRCVQRLGRRELARRRRQGYGRHLQFLRPGLAGKQRKRGARGTGSNGEATASRCRERIRHVCRHTSYDLAPWAEFRRGVRRVAAARSCWPDDAFRPAPAARCSCARCAAQSSTALARRQAGGSGAGCAAARSPPGRTRRRAAGSPAARSSGSTP